MCRKSLRAAWTLLSKHNPIAMDLAWDAVMAGTFV